MQGSRTQTKQETVGRITVIILDALTKRGKILNPAIGLGGITYLCVHENG